MQITELLTWYGKIDVFEFDCEPRGTYSAFRERQTRLLVAATNSVRSLDSAFLRPGRFDYLIPVGPPDANARRALWSRFIARTGRTDVDLDRLVSGTEGFTPADIEHAEPAAATVVPTALIERASTR